MTNGFAHHYHLGESTFILRVIRSNLKFLISVSKKFLKDGTPQNGCHILGCTVYLCPQNGCKAYMSLVGLVINLKIQQYMYIKRVRLELFLSTLGKLS